MVEQLLPKEERIHWVLEHASKLHDAGTEPVSGLVVPNNTCFPDPFDKSPESVARLQRRVLKHAGLNHLKVKTQVVGMNGDGGGCSSGACSVPSQADEKVKRVEETKRGFTVNIIANELTNPTILMTAMVRAVSHIFLREADLTRVFRPREYEHGIDLAGVLLGFGTLLANGAYVYRKG